MKDYLTEVFGDVMMSYVTRKYGSKLNDSQKQDKCDELFDELKNEVGFTIVSTQALIEKKGITDSQVVNVNGKSVYCLSKKGMFGKKKVCYFISRTKEKIDADYLNKIHDELKRQAFGENVFESPEYRNG